VGGGVRQMRNPNRIPIVLDEIRKIWEKTPDLRLGQLLWAMGTDFNVEDYDFLQSYADRTEKHDVDTSKFPEYWIESKEFYDTLSESKIEKEGKP